MYGALSELSLPNDSPIGTRSLAAVCSAGLCDCWRLLRRATAACFAFVAMRTSSRRVCSCSFGDGLLGLLRSHWSARAFSTPQGAMSSSCRPCGGAGRILADRQVGSSGNAQHGKERSRYHYDDLHDANPLGFGHADGRPK
jgi:hypothetical protein